LQGDLIHDAGGKSFELKEVSSIGRSRDSVVLVLDPEASRHHAMIRRQDDGLWCFVVERTLD